MDEAVSKNSAIKWIVVFSYRPQYSSPSVHPGNGDLRDIYHPLFQKYNVDLILQAHNHNYQTKAKYFELSTVRCFSSL